MDKLLNAVYELVLDQHSNKVCALTSMIKKCSVEDALTLKNFFATEAANSALTRVLEEWQRLGCSSDEMAGILRGASHGYLSEKAREQVQLVWTGPDLNQIPVRRSEQILLELINSAQSSLFLVSFVLVNIPKIEDAIREALERGVDVRMLLESEDKEGSNHFRDTIKRLQMDIPGLTLYVWPRERRESIEGGFARVHAKCAVADQVNAFLTSANLTSAALDKNIEMGVHIQGGSVPLTIYQQFIGMIRAKEITPYAADRYLLKTTNEPAATPVAQLADNFEVGSKKLLSFQNANLDVEEQRLFIALGDDEERPKINSIVLIRHENRWLVGKYAWSKQQDTEGGRVFYLVTVRGFGPKLQFEVEENNWESFRPRAVEINT
ncbi:DISARM system phospholipase D-like protein DrmC [Porticoccus sp.]|nr:DISARM system phospholipase D-like protein DrmC [Porticoccus sp.]